MRTRCFPERHPQASRPFRDPETAACGHLILSDTSASALDRGESSYCWDLESEIKKFEGRLDLPIGGNGALTPYTQ